MVESVAVPTVPVSDGLQCFAGNSVFGRLVPTRFSAMYQDRGFVLLCEKSSICCAYITQVRRTQG